MCSLPAIPPSLDRNDDVMASSATKNTPSSAPVAVWRERQEIVRAPAPAGTSYVLRSSAGGSARIVRVPSISHERSPWRMIERPWPSRWVSPSCRNRPEAQRRRGTRPPRGRGERWALRLAIRFLRSAVSGLAACPSEAAMIWWSTST
jgi:hypothetical protein